MVSSDYHHLREALDPLPPYALYSSCDRPWDTLRSETTVLVCLEHVTQPRSPARHAWGARHRILKLPVSITPIAPPAEHAVLLRNGAAPQRALDRLWQLKRAIMRRLIASSSRLSSATASRLRPLRRNGWVTTSPISACA